MGYSVAKPAAEKEPITPEPKPAEAARVKFDDLPDDEKAKALRKILKEK